MRRLRAAQALLTVVLRIVAFLKPQHVVLEQVRVMAPRLRDEIEMVVREAVSEAVAEELAVSRGYGSGR